MAWLRNLFGRAAPEAASPASTVAAGEWKSRGNAALQQGNLAEADRCYEQGVQADPADPTLRLNHGFVLLEAGSFAPAVDRLTQALALRRAGDDFAHEAHYLLARAHSGLGRFGEAVQACELALRERPEFREALEEGVRALQAMQRHGDAVQWARRSLVLRPSTDARMLLASTLLAGGQKAEAVDQMVAACAEQPAHREASFLYFRALFSSAKFAAALTEAQRLLALSGPDAGILGNIAAAQGRLGRPVEALAALDEALRLEPGRRELLGNRVALLSLLGRAREAVACAQEGLQLYPGDVELHWNLAVNHLLLGDFERGWAEHEWRNMDGSLGAAPGLPQPRWRGEDLAGRTILLYGEQGFGDIIQFLRFVPEVASRARTVHLQAPGALEPLLTRLPANCVLVSRSAPLPTTDYECPLMSLPLALGVTEAGIPSQVPYLHADPARARAWRPRLGSEQLNVGIAWSGKPTHLNDMNRSMPLATIMQAATAGCRFVTVQPQLREADRSALADWPELLDAGRDLKNFSDTADLVEALDLVISVDTSVAHLAGALGKPVWVLLPCVPDWRWLFDRPDSPWYPTARLLRQGAPGDWAPVVERLRQDLAQAVQRHRQATQVGSADPLTRLQVQSLAGGRTS